MYASSGFEGRLAEPLCRPGRALRPLAFSRYAAALGESTRRQVPNFVFDSGGLLAPHGLTQFALEQAADETASLVRDLGYHALVVGHEELRLPRASLVRSARALAAKGVPMIASNLRCERSARALCDQIVDSSDGVSIHPIENERVALIGIIGPVLFSRLPPKSAQGLQVLSAKESLMAASQQARKQGATVVIASVDFGQGPEAAGAALGLVASLPEGSKPDVVVVAGSGREFLFARPLAFQPALVAAPPSGIVRMQMRRELFLDTLSLIARPLDPSKYASAKVQRWIENVGPRYCEIWGDAFAGAPLDHAIDGQGLLELVASILLERTGADVAVLPRSLLEESWRPLRRGRLSASDIKIGLRFEEKVATSQVEAGWLEGMAKSPTDGPWFVQGARVEKDGDEEKVEINGRAIESKGSYRIVALESMTLDNDVALPAGPSWEILDTPSLSALLMDYFDTPRQEDPRRAVKDPSERTEWIYRIDTDATFAGAAVRNSAGYQQPLLQRTGTVTFGLDSNLRVDVRAPSWDLENIGQILYRLTQTGTGPLTEGADRTSYRATLIWKTFHERKPRFYVPEPFAENYLESELTVPATRDYRAFLVRPTGGLQFSIFEELVFRVSGGFEWQALQPGADVLPGTGFQVVLRPWEFLKKDERRVKFEGLFDYFVSGFPDLNRQTIRMRFDGAFDLTRALSLAIIFNLFGIREAGLPMATASDTSLALRVHWLRRRLGP